MFHSTASAVLRNNDVLDLRSTQVKIACGVSRKTRIRRLTYVIRLHKRWPTHSSLIRVLAYPSTLLKIRNPTYRKCVLQALLLILTFLFLLFSPIVRLFRPPQKKEYSLSFTNQLGSTARKKLVTDLRKTSIQGRNLSGSILSINNGI